VSQKRPSSRPSHPQSPQWEESPSADRTLDEVVPSLSHAAVNQAASKRVGSAETAKQRVPPQPAQAESHAAEAMKIAPVKPEVGMSDLASAEAYARGETVACNGAGAV
jgi:hypothetical protein